MKKMFFLLISMVIMSGLLLMSCQKKEEVREGAAVETFDKAKGMMDDYKDKNEEAAGYGEKAKEEAAGYGEKAKDAAAGYGH